MRLKQNTKVEFDALTHSYWLGGEKELVGVTTLMKHQGLAPDYSGISEKVLNHAAARGTAIHRTLEDYDNGCCVIQPVTVDDNEGGEVNFDTSAELAAYRELGLEVIASEYLVSDNKVVASSIDKVLATDEEDTVDLADIKTTSELHTVPLEWQLSIYAYLFELQNKGKKVRCLYGVHVRDGKAKMVSVRRIAADTIKSLIKCEGRGERFDAEDAKPELSLVMPENDIEQLIADEGRIAELETALKAAQEQIRVRKDMIYSYMLSNNINELRCPGGFYKLTRPTLRTNFDSRKLKEDNPEIYVGYVSQSEVKGRVTFRPDKMITDLI